MTTTESSASAKAAATRFREVHEKVRTELHKAIVGQDAVIDSVLTALFAGGHVLLEGVSGIGKTLLVQSPGAPLHLAFSRSQFTTHLSPSAERGPVITVEPQCAVHDLCLQLCPSVSILLPRDVS